MKASEILRLHLRSTAKYGFLSPMGAVGAELARGVGFNTPLDRVQNWEEAVEGVRLTFARKEKRLRANHPQFWRDVSRILSGLEAS